MKRCSGLILSLASLSFASASTLHIDPKARIHPTAVLMGNVTVGAYTEVGPKVVIAGDITIGTHVNILGNAVIEADKAAIGNYVRIDYGARLLQGRQAIPNITANSRPDELYVRDNCWIGMNATVRGARLEDGSSVGNGAVAEFNTHLERGAILAHGAVSAFDMVIPANSLAEGNPATVTKRQATDADRKRVFGVLPAGWIRSESGKIAEEIDRNPSQPRKSYPGIDGKQFWKGDLKIDPTAEIHPTAILAGPLAIGAHTRIGPNVILMRASVGDYCDIRANTNIRADIKIGNHVYIGERVHIGSSRDGGFDNPLWIKDNVYLGPGSVVHAGRLDDDVYYGANVTTDYGSYMERGADLKSGTVVTHDIRIRSEAVAEGNPELMETHPGISEERQMKTLGFLPKKWLLEVHSKELEQPNSYEAPIKDWKYQNRGEVKGTVQPGAILIGNVSVGEGSKIYPGAYIEGNVRIGRYDDILVDDMIVSKDLTIGDHTHIYDKAMIVDGRSGDKPYVGTFCWINHLAALQGARMEDFSLSNIGTSSAFGTRIEREALLMNGSATYADQALPAESISYGDPAMVRVTNSTMRERMAYFYGRNFPTWERQATPEELKKYSLPK
jgi:carbonic anhydrase/acetyltransferase-like protein (isoleucine patch superfamily)